MIVFVSTHEHAYTLGNFLRSHRGALHRGVIQMAYEEFLSWPRLPRGSYIFSDQDRLSSVVLAAVGQRWQQLRTRAPGLRCLNAPGRCLDRWALLDTLYRQGLNAFQARRLDTSLEGLRFPVFLRQEDGHAGPLTPPLPDLDALQTERRRLSQELNLSASQVWAVEYLDLRNDLGHFEKYSAFRVGDQIFAHDLTMSQGWVCKDEGDLIGSAEALQRDREFRQANPHAEALRHIFDAAHIDYGRIDYGIHQGRLVVFEINTNPYIIAAHLTDPHWQESDDHIREHFSRAMAALGTAPEMPYWVDLPTAGAVRIAGTTRAHRGLRRVLRRCAKLELEPLLQYWRDRLRLPQRGMKPSEAASHHAPGHTHG